MSRRAERLARRWGNPAEIIQNAELVYPVTALSIALLETGGFRSKVMMRSHNWFGFRRNGRGFQKCRSAGAVRNGYGEYDSPNMMLADYQTWEWDICLKYHLNDEQTFRRWIVQHYAEDPKYGSKLATTLAEVSKTWH